MRLAALAMATTFAASCAMVDRVAPTSEATPPVVAAAGTRSNADEMVAYLARIRTMSDSALATEAARARRESGDIARVKAAMALSLAQAEEGDILALVDPVVKNPDRDVRAMASFLHAIATDRRRLRESAAAAGAKLREERRAAEVQKQRADSLQQKLDALTELEKSLSDRTVPSR